MRFPSVFENRSLVHRYTSADFVSEVEKERNVNVAVLFAGVEHRKDGEALSVGHDVEETAATCAIELLIGPNARVGTA